MAEDSQDKEYVQYLARFEKVFRDKLKASAEENRRTLMAEITDRLEFSYKYEAWARKRKISIDNYSVGLNFANFHDDDLMSDGDVDDQPQPSLYHDLEVATELLEDRLDLSDEQMKNLAERVERIERLLRAMPSWSEAEEN